MNMVCAVAPDDDIAKIERGLLRAANGLPDNRGLPNNTGFSNDKVIARIIAAQRAGTSCLPLHLGLQMQEFSDLLQRHFPGSLFWLALHSGHDEAVARGALRQQLLMMRHDEWLDIRNLLLDGRRGDDVSEEWLAAIVAAGCLGGDHLWRDLGLSSRTQLGEMLRYNFPGIALRNDRDMKWKKFFYKQLCEREGGYVCRSPSCEQCVAYADCFGPES
ncbi:MAG: nitrogen fixation protein NifQ [Spongiibacteraceae bacterium]